ncbi:MAG: hypothetical protein KC736_00690 [Candidatus Moranbacteria bacterium]|nr:hypothetical protein [Candidatus Moranbacteria bacterium]
MKINLLIFVVVGLLSSSTSFASGDGCAGVGCGGSGATSLSNSGAFSGSTAVSGSSSSAGASSVVVNAPTISPDINVGAQTGDSSASLEDLSSSASLNYAPVTNTVYEAVKPQRAGAGTALGVNTGQQNMFTGPTAPAEANSIGALEKYLQACVPMFVNHPPRKVSADMEFSTARLWLHPESSANYALSGGEWCDPNRVDADGLNGCYADKAQSGKLLPIPVQRVALRMPPRSLNNLSCVGIMSVSGKEKAWPADLVHESVEFVQNKLQGHRELYIVTLGDYFGSNLGVLGSGWGLGVSPGMSSTPSLSTFLSLIGGFSVNNNKAEYNARFGVTMLVFAKDLDGLAIDFVSADRRHVHMPVATTVEKAQALK